MSRDSPGGTSTATASDAIGESTTRRGVRSSSLPSLEKSSQKSSRGVPQRPLSLLVRDVTPCLAVVASAIVPQAPDDVSTPADDMRMPVARSLVRAAFLLRRAPLGQLSPFQSVDVLAPSMPIKFGTLS